MIRIHRVPLPDATTSRLQQLTAELAQHDVDRVRVRAHDRWKHSSVRRSVRPRLTEALEEMAPGARRCMYCGDNEGTDIDHHEPIAENPLRTFDWLNHLLACSTCNSNHKRDIFPRDDTGVPLLIDPTSEDPFDHLLLTSVGIYHALTPKGGATIATCGLNRPVLTQGRHQARRVVAFALRGWATARRHDDTEIMKQAVLTIRQQPCADVIQSMLRQASMPGAEIAFADIAEVLPLLRCDELRSALLC